MMMSPVNDLEIPENVENAKLLAMAMERIEHGALKNTRDWDEVMKEFHISDTDLDDIDDSEVEFE